MTLLIDPPNAEGHGRMWSHLASDTSYAELHAFARALGIPERGFDRDHYDVPGEWYHKMVAAGAVPVGSRELIARLAAAGLRRRKVDTPFPRRPGRPLLRPPRLRPGDTVAVIAPAGPVPADRLTAGLQVLREWELQVRAPDPAGHRLPWLADSDAARAQALTEAWVDPAVRAVVAARGGFGSARILDLLDWDRLAAAGPKVLLGCSDVTALHQAIAARLGMVSLHGPVAVGLGDRDTETTTAARAALFGAETSRLDGLPVLAPGAAEGVTVGGNLTVLASLAGTAWSQVATGAIVFLEDVGEHPYRVDRALTQLIQSGWFAGVRGVVLGDFTDCGEPTQVRELLTARLADLSVPVLAGARFGHGRANLTLPLGVSARLDATGERGAVTFSPALR